MCGNTFLQVKVINFSSMIPFLFYAQMKSVLFLLTVFSVMLPLLLNMLDGHYPRISDFSGKGLD